MPDPNQNPADTTTLELPGGGRLPATPEEAERHKALGRAMGAPVGEVSPAVLGSEQAVKAQREAFDRGDEKLTTFIEGMADALTFGLVHERGELADLRRDVNSGSAFAGELTGTLLGLKMPGPTRLIAQGGEAAGAGAAKALGLGKLGSRVVTEAGVGAALSSAGALGHQTFDALIENKDFAAEAVVHEMGLGALLGAGAGLFGGVLGRFSKADVAKQGGLVKPGSPEALSVADHVKGAISALDDAVHQHEVMLGGARVLEDEGHLPLSDSFMADRAAAMKAVKAARAGLGDPTEGLAKLDPKFFKGLDDYQLAVRKLDDAMVMRDIERLKPITPGRAEDVPGYGHKPIDADYEAQAQPGEKANDLAARMADPAKAAAYRDLFGEDYQPPTGAEPAIQEKVTGPSVEAQTGAATPRAARLSDTVPEVPGTESEGPATAPGADNFNKALGREPIRYEPAGGRALTEPAEAGAPNTAYEPMAGRQMLPEHLAGLTEGARLIEPSAKAMAEDNLLHGEATDRPLLLLKSGRYLPQATIDANAEWFQNQYPSLVRRASMPPSDPAANAAEFSKFLDKAGPSIHGPSRFAPPRTIAEAPRGDLDALNKVVEKLTPPPKETPQVIRDYLDAWYRQSRTYGPTLSPGDRAAAKISEMTDRVYQATKGRADAVAALELGPKYGLPEPRTSLGERAQQAALLTRAADEARGLAKGAANPKSPAGSWLKRRFFGKAGAAVAGAVIGGHLAGSAGYLIGASLAGGYSDLAGRMASTAGRMMNRVAQAAEALTTGHQLTAAAAIGVGKPYAYSDQGPIEDPVDRIMELKRIAAAPETLRATVRAQLGDLVPVHPALATALENATINRTVALSVRAPAIYFDRLGQPMEPAQNAMRTWLEYEGAAHNLDRVVDALAGGSATDGQIQALHELAPATYAALVKEVLQNHEALLDMSRTQLRYVERALGLTLTRSATPGMVARNQMATSTPPISSPQGQGGGSPGPGKPQAFKLSENTMETQAQGAPSGRAPGN